MCRGEIQSKETARKEFTLRATNSVWKKSQSLGSFYLLFELQSWCISPSRSMLPGDYWDFLSDSRLSQLHSPKSKYCTCTVVAQQCSSESSFGSKKELSLQRMSSGSYLLELISLEALHLLGLCQGTSQQAFWRQSSQQRTVAVKGKESTALFVSTITSCSCFSFDLRLKFLSSLGILF